MAKRSGAKLTLTQRPDGTVVVEVHTSSTLRPIGVNGGVLEPADYLRHPSSCAFTVSGDPDGSWRRVEIHAEALGDSGFVEHRFLDLSDGSHEREMLSALVSRGQETIPVLWVNEGIESVARPSRRTLEAFGDALAATTGLSRTEWSAELDEVNWQRSDSWRPGPRPRPYRRHTADPPDGVELRFFARRTGAIPKTGVPELLDVVLPRGVRQPSRPAAYWASVEPVSHVELLVPWLVSVFSESGLWPVLWRFDEDPENYMAGGADPDGVDGVDFVGVLEQGWSRRQFGAPFPGVAIGSRSPGAGSSFPDWALSEPSRLLLVPCHRPADAVTMLGGAAGDLEGPSISAVLRSWEQRFGAVLFEVAPALIRLSVVSPPRDIIEATAAAAELLAVAAESSDVAHQPLDELAHDLLGSQRPSDLPADEPTITHDAWDVPV